MSHAVRVITASVAGAAHTLTSLPCQDAVDWFVDRNYAHVAVADGLGSAALSADGAAIAVKAAVETMRFRSMGSRDMSQLCSEAIHDARAAVIAECERRICDPRDMACTLIVASLHEDVLFTAHIGDGGVVAHTSEGPVVTSPPGDSEYVNEVDHLCLDAFVDHVRIGATSDVGAFAVFTDGIQRAALSKREGAFHPHEGFFTPIFNWAAEGGDEEELARLLQGRKLTEASDDDKTLAVVSPLVSYVVSEERSDGLL